MQLKSKKSCWFCARNNKSKRNLSRHLESLEARQLLAGDLIAHWRADQLKGLDDGAIITQWLDEVNGIPADAEGAPTLDAHGLGGRSVVRFTPEDGIDAFAISVDNNPLSSAEDFSVAVTFATDSSSLTGGNEEWFKNSGLADSNENGFTTDWGLTINQAGQVSAGLGEAFLQPTTTVYSAESSLNDGQIHQAVLSRQGGNLSLFIDGGKSNESSSASTAPRKDRIGISIGRTWFGDHPFAGGIADVRIFNGALDASEVANLFGEVNSYYNNSQPIAHNDVYTVDEDPTFVFHIEPAATGVLSNDSDPDGDPLESVLVSGTQHGAITLRADGSFLYDPDLHFFGTDEFTYVAQDFRPSHPATVTIHVLPTYDPAVPEPDSYKAIASQPFVVDSANGILSNDLNLDQTELKAVLESAVENGSLDLNENGSFTYNPLGFFGTTKFSYRIDDGTNLSSPVDVTLIINTPPEIISDFYSLDEDSFLTIESGAGVLANDADAENDALTATLLDSTSNGVLAFNANGSFIYTPKENYFGTDIFTYKINDGIDDSNTIGTVQLRVDSVNDPPEATHDAYFTLIEQPLEVPAKQGLLFNDHDIDNTNLSVQLDSDVSHGRLTLQHDGSFTYIPNAAFQGSDSFTYRVSDGAAISNVSTVTINVNSLDQLQLVVINEIHSNPDNETELVEFIEFYNRSSSPVDVSNWFFSDGVDFVFPEGSAIPAEGYLVVTQNAAHYKSEFNRDASGEWVGKLRNDGETIELRTDAGFLIDSVDYQLGFPWPTVGDAPGRSMQLVDPTIDNDLGGAWRSANPTPGQNNSTLTDNPAPRIRQVNHAPEQPTSADTVSITAKVTDPNSIGAVNLEYQLVDPGNYIRITDNEYDANWTQVVMFDNGENGDSVAKDGIFTATLSSDIQIHRRLVRYRINATDSLGASVLVPYADDPQPNFAYFVHDGIPEWTGSKRPGNQPNVTYAKEVMNRLQTYHLIANESDVERSQYNSSFNLRQFRGTLVYDGIVYDHIEYRNRGRASTYQVGKNKWKLNFTRGHSLTARDDFGNRYEENWDKINILPGTNPWWRNDVSTEGTVLFEPVAFRLYELAGAPSSKTHFFQFRIVDSAQEAARNDQYEGDFWGLYIGIEQPDGRFLNERGLPDGNIFNMHGGAGGSPQRNQGSLLPSNKSDLSDFLRAINRTQSWDWYQQNINLESYFAWNSINLAVNNSDLRPNENVNYYHNQENDQWYTIPWDLDLTFEDRPHWNRPDSQWENIQRMLRVDELEQAYDNRVREILDLLLDNGDAEHVVDEYANVLTGGEAENTFVDANQALWDYHPRKRKKGIWYRNFTRTLLPERTWESFVQYTKDFITEGGYGRDRLHAKLDESAIPNTPNLTYIGDANFPLNKLSFQTSNFADPQGNDTFGRMEWRVAEVHNPNVPNYDPLQRNIYEIEGTTWESGIIDSFQNEMVIPNSAVQPNHTYRTRVRYSDEAGNWSHWSAPVEFTATPGMSNLAESLRISEVHYHPADPNNRELAAGHTNSDDFEFIEIANIGTERVSLVGAEFIKVDVDGSNEGVEFRFADGEITELDPGQSVVVVEDLEAFRLRYSDAIPVAGQWSGQLSNGGETVTLAAFGNIFLQFAYDDSWYPNTDGNGFSMEIKDVRNTEIDGWNLRDSWQESQSIGGTPGEPVDSMDVPGDSNRDGKFDSKDLILAFQAGEYEDGIHGNSTWEEGDWNGDGEFSTQDLVFAFQAGTYVHGAIAIDSRIASRIYSDVERLEIRDDVLNDVLALEIPKEPYKVPLDRQHMVDSIFNDVGADIFADKPEKEIHF